MNLKRRQLANFLQNQAQGWYMIGNSQDEPIFSANLTTSLGARGVGDTTPTFTRATTGYVNDYENIPRQVLSGEARFHGALRVHNQFLPSQDFSSVNWTKNAVTGSTFTGIADPFGGTTACKLIGDNAVAVDGNNGFASIAQSVTKIASTVDVVSLSVYAKAGESHVLRVREQTTSGYRAVFNLITGSISYENSATPDNFSAQMTAVGNGWYRCQVRYTTAGAATQNFCFKASGPGTSVTCDGVSGLYLAFAQYEDVSGSAVLACSPYVSNGAISSPWHGANVDGVKYFSQEEIHNVNLLRQSEDLAKATFWSFSGAAPTTVVSVGNVGPFGGNATRIVFASGTSLRTNGVGAHIQYGRSYMVGAWVKSNTTGNQTFRLNMFDSLATWYSDDLIATQQWQYFTFGPVKSLGTTGFLARIANSVAATPDDILVGGMTCYEDSPYISTSYVSNVSDYSGFAMPTGQYINISNSTAKGFFSEVTAANLLIESETFDTASWGKTDTTVTANFAPAPNGKITADRIATGAAGTDAVVQSGRTIVANTPYTFSVYLRAGNTTTGQWIRLRYLNNAGTDGGNAWFDIVNGVLGTVSVSGAGTLVQAEISPSYNNYYRCSITATVDAASVLGLVQIITANADNSTTRFNTATYYMWGAQLEINSEMTSYIPTTAASVTRNADYLVYPNTGNVTDALGTVYHEMYRLSTNVIGDRRSFSLSGNTVTRLQAITGQSSVVGTHVIAGTGASTITTIPSTLGLGLTLRKQAIRWENGVLSSLKSQVNNATLGTVVGTPSVTSTNICPGGIVGGGLQLNGTVRNLRIYKIAVTDEQLTNMTA